MFFPLILHHDDKKEIIRIWINFVYTKSTVVVVYILDKGHDNNNINNNDKNNSLSLYY